MLSQALFMRQIAAGDAQASIIVAAKMEALEQFVAEDLLAAVNVSVPQVTSLRASSHATVQFTSFGEMPRQVNLSVYQALIENNFSRLERSNVTLRNLTTNITITGQNVTAQFLDNETYLFFGSPNTLRNLSVTLRTNGTVLWNSSVPVGVASNQNFSVIVQNSSGYTVLSTLVSLSPNATSAPISVTFNRSGFGMVKLQFGTISGRNGTLRISSDHLQVIPQDLKIGFSLLNTSLTVRQDTIVCVQVGGFAKNASPVLRKI